MHITYAEASLCKLPGDLNLQDWEMAYDHKSRGWKIQDWQMTDEVSGVENDGLPIDEIAGVDNAGLENDGRSCKGGN